mmetsp:Transcript_84161/g.103113  ORF Transcript_84161/g.103113 Transcript_84161/m.103113 type:complete len:80 (-) Transcript_84161:263-502(-)
MDGCITVSILKIIIQCVFGPKSGKYGSYETKRTKYADESFELIIPFGSITFLMLKHDGHSEYFEYISAIFNVIFFQKTR